MLRAIGAAKGLPLALYIDRHGIFTKRASVRLTLQEELTGTPMTTQVGQTLDELGIRRIHALSPEGKGRIERMGETIQGRLVAEVRLEGQDDRGGNRVPAGLPGPAQCPLRRAGRQP